MSTFNELWKKQMKERGLKFFVIKADDLFDSLTEDELVQFDEILGAYNTYREPKPINEYYVINKDDVPHIKDKEEFFKLIGYETKNSSN